MKNKYYDLIDQTFDFPQEDFSVEDNELLFHDMNMMDIVREYGSPLKFTYLPKIGDNINKVKGWFENAFDKNHYKANYHYCYCTKSSHFSYVIEEALKHDIKLETSSAFDINIIENLYEKGLIDNTKMIIHNGYKKANYVESIARLQKKGFTNVLPVLDNTDELKVLEDNLEQPFQVGIRIASEEEPKFEFYTSRLGIGYKQIIEFYKERIHNNPNVELRMLHFFVNTGINDNAYYWNELNKCLRVYCELKKICPTLNALNLGGGFPIKNSLAFNFDYEYIINEIAYQIKSICDENFLPVPDLYTEFGSYTVGESGGVIFSVLHQKKQNDKEKWDMIDGSFMTTLPDTWAINKRFIMLPLNRWDSEYERVFLGGLTCDSDDYYNSEQHVNAIYLPRYNPEEKLYIGFFHTGAYQDTIGGFGGIQHCLIPKPKHILIDRDEDDNITTKLFSEEQSPEQMLKLLGY